MEQVPPTFASYSKPWDCAPEDFTPELKDRFLEWYRRTGLLAFSCEMVGVDPIVVRNARKEDKRFKRLCEAAREGYSDTLVLEAHRRAVEGVERPVLGGKDRDQVITYVRVYSDKLLQSLLKAYREEFKDQRQPLSVEVGSGGVLLLPSKLEGQEWENEHGAAGSKD